jgi:hypothetical protein
MVSKEDSGITFALTNATHSEASTSTNVKAEVVEESDEEEGEGEDAMEIEA